MSSTNSICRLRRNPPAAENDTKNFPGMTKTFSADRATIMSPRTAKYVKAMVREDFDYGKWLQRVRQEEAQAKLAEATGTPCELAPVAMSKSMSTPDGQDGRQKPPLRLLPKIIQVPRATSRSTRKLRDNTPKTRLRRWLENVHCAWGKFQTSRARDGVYGYLEAVFAIVEHYKVRRRTTRLLRHAFRFADLPFDKEADSFSAVIRCTCNGGTDSKTISKYARALRFCGAAQGARCAAKAFHEKAGRRQSVR
jgi:hypothetical protein